MSRLRDLVEFYRFLDQVEAQCGGKRRLAECHGRMEWPRRGIYFFFEEGETRSHSGNGPRVTRVGTHALTATSNTTLWNRLGQHRGVASGKGGNHRGSIFRLLVGSALRNRDAIVGLDSWGIGSDPGKVAERLRICHDEVKHREANLEEAVSTVIGSMPFLWLEVDDAPGPTSLRGYLERNAIALLSNYGKDSLDPSSQSWLGRFSDRSRVRESGLWNNNHVDEAYAPDLIRQLNGLMDLKRSGFRGGC